MAAVVGDFLRDPDIPPDLVEFAICEAMRVLRHRGVASGTVLAYCRRAISTQAAQLNPGETVPRRIWLDEQLARLLLRCYGGA